MPETYTFEIDPEAWNNISMSSMYFLLNPSLLTEKIW
jgi:hypothetical protein